MKFKDKNGNVFESIHKALDEFCGLPEDASKTECRGCVFDDTALTCVEFCDENPKTAARLMGYEVIEDEKEESMENTKPLSEWTLGELKRWCKITAGKDACGNGGCPFAKTCDLLTERSSKDVVPGDWDLTDKPRFTDTELEQIRAIAVLFGAEAKARRTYNGERVVVSLLEDVARVRGSLLPSLKPGKEIKVKDYICHEDKTNCG